MSPEVHVEETADALAADVASRLVPALLRAQQQHGRAALALTAGGIMERVWTALADSATADQVGEPAGHDQERREDDVVGVQHPGQPTDRRTGEGSPDLREGHVDDPCVQERQEGPERGHQQHPRRGHTSTLNTGHPAPPSRHPSRCRPRRSLEPERRPGNRLV